MVPQSLGWKGGTAMAVDLQMEDQAEKQGKLTIFASYFSGAGKSFAMLKAAEKARAAGVDVVIGLSPSEPWPDTQAFAAGFERVSGERAQADGPSDDDRNLDACLKRRPQLVLVDDLSHRNADNSRHRKRYQDIEELLKAGVDVYTTLDIQHIESIQDSVLSILNVPMLERIPDHVFDRAAQVEFIDIEPERLQQRLLRQKKGALLSSCSFSQLSALREVGLRRFIHPGQSHPHRVPHP